MVDEKSGPLLLCAVTDSHLLIKDKIYSMHVAFEVESREFLTYLSSGF